MFLAIACERAIVQPIRPEAALTPAFAASDVGPGVNIANQLDSFAVGGVYTVLPRSGYPRLVAGALLYDTLPVADAYANAIRGHPTGIDLPVALPVRVLAEGADTSTSTSLFRDGYCKRPGISDPICQYLHFSYSVHGLEPDSGVQFPYVDGTGLEVQWSRLGPRTFASYPSPEFFRDTVPANGASATAELHFRRNAGCCYYQPFGDAVFGPWETYTGRWRFGAVVDDGGRVELGEPPVLRMSGPRTDAPMSTAAQFTLTAASGSLSAVKWWFIRPTSNQFDGISPGTGVEAATGFQVPQYPPERRSVVTDITECANQVTCMYQATSPGAVVARATVAPATGAGVVLAARNTGFGESPAVSVAVSAGGPNPSGSFVTNTPEALISLTADVTNAPTLGLTIQWIVEDDPTDRALTLVPSLVRDGSTTTFVMPDIQYYARYKTYAHRQGIDIERLSLLARARAVLNTGGEVLSEPVTVRQDSLDGLREEYSELRVVYGVPARSRFQPEGPTRLNDGDYDWRVVSPSFEAKVDALVAAWAGEGDLRATISGGYRSPVHNWLHIKTRSGSGPVGGSWHMYGCALDFQTQPILTAGSSASDVQDAGDYWYQLSTKARSLGFGVEQRDQDPNRPNDPFSGVGHVHVQIKCP